MATTDKPAYSAYTEAGRPFELEFPSNRSGVTVSAGLQLRENVFVGDGESAQQAAEDRGMCPVVTVTFPAGKNGKPSVWKLPLTVYDIDTLHELVHEPVFAEAEARALAQAVTKAEQKIASRSSNKTAVTDRRENASANAAGGKFTRK